MDLLFFPSTSLDVCIVFQLIPLAALLNFLHKHYFPLRIFGSQPTRVGGQSSSRTSVQDGWYFVKENFYKMQVEFDDAAQAFHVRRKLQRGDGDSFPQSPFVACVGIMPASVVPCSPVRVVLVIA